MSLLLKTRNFLTIELMLGLCLLIALSIHTWDSADTFMHLNYGLLAWQQGVLIPSSPMIMQHPDAVFYWFFRLILLGLFKVGGVVLVSVSFVGLWIATWHLLLKASRLYKVPTLGLAWFCFALLTVTFRMTPRPEVISYFFIAVYLSKISLWLKLPAPDGVQWKSSLFLKHASLVLLLQVVWVGCHGYFIFGPLLLCLAGLTSAIPRKASDPSVSIVRKRNRGASARTPAVLAAVVPPPSWLKHFLLLSLVATVASCLNPRGVHVWISAYRHVFLLAELKEFISEFDTAFKLGLAKAIWPLPFFWGLWFASLVVTLLTIIKDRKISFAAAVSVLGILLSYRAARSIPFLPLLSCLVWGDVLTRAANAKFFRSRFVVISVWASTIALTVAFVSGEFYRSQMSRKSFGFGLSAVAHPVDIARYFMRHPFTGLVFNAPEDGGYLAYYLPSLRLFGDTQFTETQPTKDYVAASTKEGFDRLHGRYRFDAAVLEIAPSFQLALELMASKEWILVFGDLYRVVLVRASSRYFGELKTETPAWFSKDSPEDLATLVSAYPAALWASLIAQRLEWPVMQTYLESIPKAAQVPSPLLLAAGQVAANLNHQELSLIITRLSLRRKSYGTDDEAKVQMMLQSLP